MNHIEREGEPGLRQDLLIYGKEYHCWRDGEYIGIATHTDDPNIGDCFLKEIGEDRAEVFIPDEWQFA